MSTYPYVDTILQGRLPGFKMTSPDGYAGRPLPEPRLQSGAGRQDDFAGRLPWATGRKNWLFAGTLAAGQRAAVITSLIQSAKLNGRDPYAYLKDVLERLPTQRASAIDQLLPHRWSPQV